jgi:hypothetical protein
MKFPMGLDKGFLACFNEYVTQLSHSHLGPGGFFNAIGQGLATLLGRGKKSRQSPLAAERKRYEREVREQLVQLKEKGISIPVFTL